MFIVVFLIKPFVDLKYVCIKKWTYKISARFHGLTEMSRDRNDQDRNGSDRIDQTENPCALPSQPSLEETQAWK